MGTQLFCERLTVLLETKKRETNASKAQKQSGGSCIGNPVNVNINGGFCYFVTSPIISH